MRTIRRLFLALLALSWPASAQIYPSIPGNTILGRLGGGNPGPPQAIPFATLTASVFSLSAPPPIGNNTPNTGAFTTLSASGAAGVGTYCAQIAPGGAFSNTGAGCVSLGTPQTWTATQTFSGTDTENGSSSATACLNTTAGPYGCTQGYTTTYNCQNGASDQTNIANLVATSGVNGLVLRGKCLVSANITLPVNFDLSGDGMGSQLGGTLITLSSATANGFTLASGDHIHNLTFTVSITRTAGDNILASGVSNISIDHVAMYGVWNGVHLHGVGSPAGACPGAFSNAPCSGAHLSDLRIYGPASVAGNDCVLIDGASGVTQPWNVDVRITRMFCSGVQSAGMVNGIEIQTAGDVNIDNAEIEFAGTGCTNGGINIDPSGAASSGNTVNSVIVSNSYSDAGGGNGVIIQPSSSATVNVVNIHHNWISSNASCNGVEVIATGTIEEVDVDNNFISFNADGVKYTGASTAFVQELGNVIDSNTTDGIVVDSNVVGGFNIQANTIRSSGTDDLLFGAASYTTSRFIGNIFSTSSGTPTLTVSANNSPSNP